jgi:hypothetical protein
MIVVKRQRKGLHTCMRVMINMRYCCRRRAVSVSFFQSHSPFFAHGRVPQIHFFLSRLHVTNLTFPRGAGTDRGGCARTLLSESQVIKHISRWKYRGKRKKKNCINASNLSVAATSMRVFWACCVLWRRQQRIQFLRVRSSRKHMQIIMVPSECCFATKKGEMKGIRSRCWRIYEISVVLHQSSSIFVFFVNIEQLFQKLSTVDCSFVPFSNSDGKNCLVFPYSKNPLR